MPDQLPEAEIELLGLLRRLEGEGRGHVVRLHHFHRPGQLVDLLRIAPGKGPGQHRHDPGQQDQQNGKHGQIGEKGPELDLQRGQCIEIPAVFCDLLQKYVVMCTVQDAEPALPDIDGVLSRGLLIHGVHLGIQ